MKSLVRQLELLLLDEGSKCGVDVRRDVGTLRARVEHEGLSFCTIALAAYGQCFDQALANGSPVPGGWADFGRLRSGLPSFLKGFLHRVFDKRTARLLDDPCVDCIRAVRHLCRHLSKVQIPCSTHRDQAALESFEDTEQTLRELPCPLPRRDVVEDADERPTNNRLTGLWQTYERVAATLVAAMPLQDEDGNVPVLCRHGPGATLEKHTPNGKWAIEEWHEELEAAGFTFRLAMLGAEKALWGCENVPIVPRYVARQDERPVKVTLVPKTLKGPRVIAVEPAARQFAQQGLAAALRYGIDHCQYTSGRINFTDQSVNQRLALLSSSSGENSTIDLKDASDRVSCDHVRVLFDAAPEQFRKWLWATRGERALLPNGREIDLQKYASMGSAMCFPVEALTFFAMVVAIRLHSRGEYVSPSHVAKRCEGVYVYGDDIVVPADETPTILIGLEDFGLLVNRRKTFWTGRFRESCGVDAYDGHDVTPTYLRHSEPEGRSDAQRIVSWVATANALSQRGCLRAAHALQEHVERLLGRLPTVPENSPALGWRWHSDHRPITRWNRRLQRRETLCWVPKPRRQPDPLTSEVGLLAKCLRRVKGNPLPGHSQSRRDWTNLRSSALAMVEQEPEAPTPHLCESDRPHALTLKRAWVAL